MSGMSTTFAERAVPLRQRVAAEVRAYMGRHGLTQTRMAELLHWRQQYLSRRLTGHVPFDTDDLAALADLFGVAPDQFLRTPANPGKVAEAVRRRCFSALTVLAWPFSKYNNVITEASF